MKVPKQNWESIAEANQNFHHKMPTRFQQKLSEEELQNKPTFKPNKVMKTCYTTNKNFMIQSAKDIEKIVEEMKSYQFKATDELNSKIIEKKGMYGVKHVPPLSSTEQKPFSFKMEQRISHWKSNDSNLEADVNDCVGFNLSDIFALKQN